MNLLNHQITIAFNNIHIEDSCNLTKKELRYIIGYLQEHYPDIPVIRHRSRYSLLTEAATHNALYALGIQRERTKDCDLDYPCDKPAWLYCIIGTLIWPFIK